MKQTLLLFLFFLMTSGLAAQSAGGDELRVYPNPVVSYFQVSDNDDSRLVRVLNMLGREVRRFDFVEGQRYDICDLPRGMYLVQFQDKQGKVLRTLRINKQ